MKSDLRLKGLCAILFIFSAWLLWLGLSLVEFETKEGEWKYVWANYLVWISAGICASSFLLILTKIFDYHIKKNELLTDFFTKAVSYNIILSNVPCDSSGNISDKTIEYYCETFKETRLLWYDMKNIHMKMYFSIFDKKMEKTVNKIMDFYKEIYPFYVRNSVIIQYMMGDAGAILTYKNSINDIFSIDEYSKEITNPPDPSIKIKEITKLYYPKTYKIIRPILQKVEKKLGKKVTEIPERNASERKIEYEVIDSQDENKQG